MTSSGPAEGDCTEPTPEPLNEGVIVNTVCTSKDDKQIIRATFSGDFETRYHGTLKTTFDPPLCTINRMGVKIDGKYLCEACGDTAIPPRRYDFRANEGITDTAVAHVLQRSTIDSSFGAASQPSMRPDEARSGLFGIAHFPGLETKGIAMGAVVKEDKKRDKNAKKDKKAKKNGKLSIGLPKDELESEHRAGDVRAAKRKINNEAYEKELARL